MNCEQWLQEALAVNPNSPLVFLIGNKMDLLSPASFFEMKKMVIKTAGRLKAEFWPVSARTGENVEEMFHRMAALVFDSQLRREISQPSPTLQIGIIVDSSGARDFVAELECLPMAAPAHWFSFTVVSEADVRRSVMGNAVGADESTQKSKSTDLKRTNLCANCIT